MEDLLLKYKVITHKEKTRNLLRKLCAERREEAFPPAFFCLALFAGERCVPLLLCPGGP